ncbi:MAG: hypothetical protein GX458_15670 [Phyllobacteriaceae bacterium]|nr:hypothetical protein [Phyllobacteriaceae bacterium]
MKANTISIGVFSTIVCAVLLSGCETTEANRIAYDHASASSDQFLKDRYACIKESMGFVQSGKSYVTDGYGQSRSEGKNAVNGPVFNNCMALKGYTQNDEAGRLVVPPALVVPSYD